MGQVERGNVIVPRTPGEINPNIQAALSDVPEFAILDSEVQITVTEQVAVLLHNAAREEADV